jgi:hypothetical protein
MNQMNLFDEADDIEDRVQAILARRRSLCCSGGNGEDAHLIRAALQQKAAA